MKYEMYLLGVLIPLIGILGGIFMPGDGQADPIGVTNLLAKAARKEGVKIFIR